MKKIVPPSGALRILEDLSLRFNLPEVSGDLQELFYKRVEAGNPRKAKILFWLETFHAVPSMWLTYSRRKKRNQNQSSNHLSMIYANIIVGLRHILKRPGFSFITITGLALGIAACLLIFDYVRFEKSFDNYHQHANRIAMMQYHFKTNDVDSKSPAVPFFVGPKALNEFPEVENQTRFLPAFGSRVVKIDDNLFEEGNFAFADSSLFQVLSYTLIEGNPTDQLKRPKTMVLSRKTAQKFFGATNPIGKTILYNNSPDNIYEVTGIYEDLPPNSHIRFDFLFSFSSLGLPLEGRFDSPNFITYLLLAENTNLAALEKKVNTTWRSQMGETLNIHLQSLRNVHFDTSVSNYGDKIQITDPTYLLIFSVVAILILVIGCINYINLVTARANERGKEVGIRKLSGGSVVQLFSQFLTDSFLHIMPAILVALILFFLTLPMSNNFLGLNREQVSLANNLHIFQWATLILVVVTILAGFYPAVIMTSLRPVSVLKGKFNASRTANSLRKGLVVFQFTVSIALIICAAVVSGQLTFMQNKKLGYDKEQILILPADAKVQAEYNAFETELKKLAYVKQVVPMSATPTEIVIGNGAYLNIGDKPEEFVTVGGVRTTEAFIDGLNVKLLAGRNFSMHKNILADTGAFEFLVNETFMTKFGLSESETLGRKIILGKMGTIVGIVSDFHSGSLHQKIEPIVLFDKPLDYIGIRKLLVKLSPGEVSEQLNGIEKVWKSFAPHRPFSFTFLDENYNSLYRTEMKINTLTYAFSGLAMVIACLGILGLASYSTSLRTKEIGIRKVLGASPIGIVMLVSKDFLSLILIAFCLAVPVSFYFASDWLLHFEYRISLQASHFMVAGSIALLFAALTICYQALKASQLNPAETLKSE